MTAMRKIGTIWLSAVAVFLVLFLLPHESIKASEFISCSLQMLLFILCIFIIRHEPTSKNKYIFINFALFFSLSIPFYFYNFVGSGTMFFSGEPYARFYMNQYISFGAYFFLLAFAIVYLTVDALFRDYRILQKYILALIIVGGFFGYYYSPYFADPKHLYNTTDLLDWKTLDRSSNSFRSKYSVEPTAENLAETTEMYSWKNGEAVGTLFLTEKRARVAELYPYLNGTNYLILLYRPIYFNTIYMCVVCIGFILLYFGYQYKKDPPQGAYIEKIMFLFLLFCSLEVLHAWSFVKSLEWQTFAQLLSIGQYVSNVILLRVAVFFGLRFHFITSVKGEFYEQEIVSSPADVTRWRDWFDNLVIAHFFNRKALLGRLFVDPRQE